MFLEVEAGAAAMGEQGRAPAGTDQLDLEAAEQLIQLSGGDGDGESETRSVDSVNKCCRREKEKEAAVESRRRRRSAVAERVPARKGGAGADDRDGHVDDGEPRKRPRFRSLADIYRETAEKRAAGGEEGGESSRKIKRTADDEEGESPMEKKRAGEEVIPVEASKVIRRDLVGALHTHV